MLSRGSLTNDAEAVFRLCGTLRKAYHPLKNLSYPTKKPAELDNEIE